MQLDLTAGVAVNLLSHALVHNTSATIQSNEFKFSVVDERVAQQIDSNSSRQIKLHWKRYLGTLPWRGNSQFVVDSIISVRQAAPKVEDDLLEMPLPVEN